jgi:hypothetical protein
MDTKHRDIFTNEKRRPLGAAFSLSEDSCVGAFGDLVGNFTASASLVPLSFAADNLGGDDRRRDAFGPPL